MLTVMQELGRQDAVAQQTVQHALADLQTAKKQVEAAKANVSALEVNLRYSTIYAPLSGTIGISAVKQGASVSPGINFIEYHFFRRSDRCGCCTG